MSPFEDVCAQLAAQVLDFFIQIDSGGDAWPILAFRHFDTGWNSAWHPQNFESE
jgi:hypothetical protein